VVGKLSACLPVIGSKHRLVPSALPAKTRPWGKHPGSLPRFPGRRRPLARPTIEPILVS